MTKDHSNIEWVCQLHDKLTADEEAERVWLEKHFGHKPYVLAKRLEESHIVFTMSHEMLDHLHNMAIGAKGMVTIGDAHNLQSLTLA
jgi:hypothetical protein